MWYYRTEVRNNTDRPLTVVAFEGYSLYDGVWVSNNVKRRELNADDFRQWYGDGNGRPASGAIPPGGVAVCTVNWHGATRPWSGRTKWVYQAVDDQGHEYHAEAEVHSRFAWTRRTVAWLGIRAVIAVALVAALVLVRMF
ncbi:MAG: hypothetical protein WD042_00210 [Phycisphaeraceae bacterium]